MNPDRQPGQVDGCGVQVHAVDASAGNLAAQQLSVLYGHLSALCAQGCARCQPQPAQFVADLRQGPVGQIVEKDALDAVNGRH